jgi:hypothetical protein
MEKGSDGLRERLLARLPQPENGCGLSGKKRRPVCGWRNTRRWMIGDALLKWRQERVMSDGREEREEREKRREQEERENREDRLERYPADQWEKERDDS